MKIVQLFKFAITDLALDDEGNLYRIFFNGVEGMAENGVDAWNNELKFVRIKQVFEDFVKN